MCEIRQLEENPQDRDTQEYDPDAESLDDVRLTSLQNGSKGALDHKQPTVKDSPEEITQSGPVPQPAKSHDNHQVDVRSKFTTPTAAKGDVKVCAQPTRQRDVPTLPEIRERCCNVGQVEIDRQTIAKQKRKSNRYG